MKSKNQQQLNRFAGASAVALLLCVSSLGLAQTAASPVAPPSQTQTTATAAPAGSIGVPNGSEPGAGTYAAQPASATVVPAQPPPAVYVLTQPPPPAPAAAQPQMAQPPLDDTETAPRAKPWHSTGFHFAIGLGPSGGYGYPGVATQFKIGVTATPELRIYYYALNHWFKVPSQQTYAVTPGSWRILAINGVGVDYFFHHRVGGRVALGAGGHTPADWGGSSKWIGYAYAMGLTFEILNGSSRLTVDPMLLFVNYKNNGDYWVSNLSGMITLNYALN